MAAGLLAAGSILTFSCSPAVKKAPIEWQYGRPIHIIESGPIFWPYSAQFSANPNVVLVHCVNETTAHLTTSNGILSLVQVSSEALHIEEKFQTQPKTIQVRPDAAGGVYVVGDQPYVTNPRGTGSTSKEGVYDGASLHVGTKKFRIDPKIGGVFDATTIDGQPHILTSKGLYSVDPQDGVTTRVLELYGHAGYILSSKRIAVIDSNYKRLATFSLDGKLLKKFEIKPISPRPGAPAFWEFCLGPERKAAYVVHASGHILSTDGVLYETGTATLEWQSRLLGGINPCLVDDRYMVIYVFAAPGKYGSIPYRVVVNPDQP